AYGGTAVVQGGADPLQLAPVELPAQDAADVAVEGHFLDRDIDMLAAAAARAFEMCSHGAGSSNHVGVETAGIECLLDRCAVGLAGEAQRAPHGRSHQFAAVETGGSRAAAERRHGDMNERRKAPFQLTALPATGGQ